MGSLRLGVLTQINPPALPRECQPSDLLSRHVIVAQVIHFFLHVPRYTVPCSADLICSTASFQSDYSSPTPARAGTCRPARRARAGPRRRAGTRAPRPRRRLVSPFRPKRPVLSTCTTASADAAARHFFFLTYFSKYFCLSTFLELLFSNYFSRLLPLVLLDQHHLHPAQLDMDPPRSPSLRVVASRP